MFRGVVGWLGGALRAQRAESGQYYSSLARSYRDTFRALYSALQ